jgi:hypothetical protein
MADKYVPGMEFQSWTSVPGGGGGLGTVAAAYLAHKAGLIDLNNKEQMDSIQKNGFLGHTAMKALEGAAKPPVNVNAPVAPVTVGGPMNQEMPKGTPLPPISDAAGGDVATSMLDHELIDSSLPNFAALFA